MSSSLELDADGFTQIVDLDVPRVDLVDKAANGTKFLLMKSEDPQGAGLLDTDTVRALAKATTELEETPVSDPIVKDDLDPTEPLVGDSPSAATPASPEWEQVDADSAKKWIAVLNFARYAVSELSAREIAEANVAGSDDGYDNAWNLDDAACAIDYAIGQLAVYAAGEEGDIAIAEEIAKALQPLNGLDLGATQSAIALRKSGRVLSAGNEERIRNAVDNLTKVLDTLPAAPEEETTVAKNENTEPDAAEVAKAEDENTEPEQPIVKDDGDGDDADPLVVCFDSKGNIIGVVPKSQIQPVEGAAAPEDAAAPAPAAAAAEDTAAAPKADAGVAADVAKGEETPAGGDFTKELAELRSLVKSQGEEIEFLKSPARPRVALNGVTPKGALPLPEHNRQDGEADLAKAALSDEEIDALKKTAMQGATPQERQAAAERLTEATTALWQHGRATFAG